MDKDDVEDEDVPPLCCPCVPWPNPLGLLCNRRLLKPVKALALVSHKQICKETKRHENAVFVLDCWVDWLFMVTIFQLLRARFVLMESGKLPSILSTG